MNDNLELHKIINEIDPRENIINSTPDGNYALRILEYYRLRCNDRWDVKGLSDDKTAIYDLMNEHQELRAIELDRAIAILEAKETELLLYWKQKEAAVE